MRILIWIALCACVRSPITDPGGDVPVVTSARAGSLQVALCSDPLPGDSHGPAASYLIDPGSGVVARWAGPAPSPLATVGGRFAGKRGEIAQREYDVVLAHDGATSVLFERTLLVSAAWTPDGARAALVTMTYLGGAQPADGATSLWLLSLEGSAVQPLPLPARPRDLITRWLDLPYDATAVSAVAWLGDDLVLFSNHESRCWSGGQDIPGGCERALYRRSPDGKLKRISPRAFGCRSLEVTR
jgi:hypothetical protein